MNPFGAEYSNCSIHHLWQPLPELHPWMLYKPFLLVLTRAQWCQRKWTARSSSRLEAVPSHDFYTLLYTTPSHNFTCSLNKWNAWSISLEPCWINKEKTWELCHEPQWVCVLWNLKTRFLCCESLTSYITTVAQYFITINSLPVPTCKDGFVLKNKWEQHILMWCSISTFSTRSLTACPSPFRKQRIQGRATYPVTAPGEKGDRMSERKEKPFSFEISKCPKMETVTGGEYCAMQFDLILWTIHFQLESSITFNCQNQKTRLTVAST